MLKCDAATKQKVVTALAWLSVIKWNGFSLIYILIGLSKIKSSDCKSKKHIQYTNNLLSKLS